MNNNPVLDTHCQNITCKKPLTDYELERQNIRAYRYRFCRRCRQMPNNSLKSVVWKCKICTVTMDARSSTRGKFYCDVCANTESIRRSKLRSRKYYLAKRGSRAV